MLNKNAWNILFQDIVCLSYVVNDNRTKSGSNPSMTKGKKIKMKETKTILPAKQNA
jgi:hypothetical protein